MSKTSKLKDKRSRIVLELSVLALVSGGLVTPYDLKNISRHFAWASIPVLNRLESAGYLRKGEAGSRNRQEYLATPRGTSQEFLARAINLLAVQMWKSL